MTEPYDWADDPDLDAGEILRRFEALTEVVRRDLASRHRDDVVEGSGVPIAPKRLGTVRSVRMSAELDEQVRAASDRAGLTVSDYLRHLADGASRPSGFGCRHVSMSTGGAPALTSVTSSCGCEMQPIYATT